MEILDVLYTINDKYLDIMLASAISLILNGNMGKIRLHIITSDFCLEDYHKIEDVLCKYSKVELYFYDVKNFNIEKFNIPNWRGTQIANARLFFQEILGANIDSINNLLYLDSDTIVVSDLNELEKFKEHGICAAKDGCYKSYLKKMGELSNYFNSGVLLFNVPEWTNNDYQDRIIHFLENNNLQLMYPDQDTLNCSLDGSIEKLPLNYNLGANAYLFNTFLEKLYYTKNSNISYEEIEEAEVNPKILHSTGILSIKAWSDNNINPFNEIFMKYILMANPEFKKEELSRLKKLLSLSPEIFKLLVIAKAYMPEPVRDFARKLTL